MIHEQEEKFIARGSFPGLEPKIVSEIWRNNYSKIFLKKRNLMSFEGVVRSNLMQKFQKTKNHAHRINIIHTYSTATSNFPI